MNVACIQAENYWRALIGNEIATAAETATPDTAAGLAAAELIARG